MSSTTLPSIKSIELPLNQLELSEFNMRKGRSIDSDFVNSIKENGVVQALTVVKNEDNELHAVVAGRRRWLALKTLEKKGLVDPEILVPCAITTTEAAATLSIVENYHRVKPHPSELYSAVAALLDKGDTKKDICRHLNLSAKEFDKIIRLSSVHKKIFKAYAANKLSEAQVYAFAATDDTKKQIDIWSQSDFDTNIPPYQIKKMLSTGITSKDAVVVFIGMKAYNAANGTSTHDLFEDTYHLNEPEIVIELAKNKLEAEKAEFLKAEPNWKWCNIYVPNIMGEDPGNFSNVIHPKRRKLTPEQKSTIEKLKADVEKYQAIEDKRDITAEEDAAWDLALETLEEQETKIQSENENFSKAEVKSSGVILTLASDGSVKFRKGLQTREDVKQVKNNSPTKENSDTTQHAADNPEYSQALRSDTSQYITSIMQAEVLQHPHLAIELMHYSICYKTLSLGYVTIPNDIAPRIVHVDTSLDDYEQSTMHGHLKKAQSELELSWLEIESEKERIDAFISLSDKAKRNLLAYLSALTLSNDPDNYIRTETAVDIRKYWQPTTDNYFKRVSKDKLLEHCSELDLTPGEATSTKKTLVTYLSELFTTSKAKNVKAWVPPLLR